MADDIALIWFTMDEHSVRATRWQVRQWCEELDLPTGALTRENTLACFVSACSQTRVTYRDSAGVKRMILAHESRRRPEYIVWDVVRDDSTKLAQMKYFMPRRNEHGKVNGSHRVMPTVSKTVDAQDADAVTQWMSAATATFEQLQGDAPWPSVRRLIRSAMTVTGIPIHRRTTMYYAYTDELGPCERTGEFITRCMPDAQFEIARVHPDTDRQVFVRSADAWLNEQAGELTGGIESWVANTGARKKTRKAALRTWEREAARLEEEKIRHERRLALSLPQTSATLAMTVQMMDALAPSASLPNVSNR